MALADNTFLTLTAPDSAPNARVFEAGAGLQVTDGGPGAEYTVAIDTSSPLNSLLVNATPGIIVFNGADYAARSIAAGDGSLSVTNATGALGNPTLAVVPNTTVQKVGAAASSGGAVVGNYPRLNFIAGAGASVAVTDFGGGAAANVTISVTDDISGAIEVSNVDDGTPATQYGRINFLEEAGSGMQITLAPGVASGSINVTLGVEGGGIAGKVQAAVADTGTTEPAYQRFNFLPGPDSPTTFTIEDGVAAGSANILAHTVSQIDLSDTTNPATTPDTVQRLNFMGGGSVTVDVTTSQGGTFGDVTISASGLGPVATGISELVSLDTYFTTPTLPAPFDKVSPDSAGIFVPQAGMTDTGLVSAWPQGGAFTAGVTYAAEGHLSVVTTQGYPDEDPTIDQPGFFIFTGESSDVGTSVGWSVIAI